jgi:hypothetical protein
MNFIPLCAMKNIVLTTLLAFAIIFSCKKKNEPVTPPVVTVVSTTGTTGATTGETIATFSAVCSNQKSYAILNGITYSVSTGQNLAVFTNTLFNNFTAPNGPYVNAGTISLNNKIFKNVSDYYTDSTSSVMASPFVWSGSGGTITAFTFTNTNSFATYADYIYWPDTIKKSEGFTVSLSGLQQAKEVQLLISNSGNPSQLSYTALASAGSINVSTLSLASLQTNTSAVIQCNFFKNNIQTIGGTLVNFRNVTTFIKTVQVKN